MASGPQTADKSHALIQTSLIRASLFLFCYESGKFSARKRQGVVRVEGTAAFGCEVACPFPRPKIRTFSTSSGWLWDIRRAPYQPLFRCVFPRRTGVAESCSPSARTTLRTVASSGLPSVLRARYRLSRDTPACRATSLIPRARATTPSASATNAGSSLSSASLMYAAMDSLSSRYSAGSNGFVFALLIPSPSPAVWLFQCPGPACSCLHRRAE
jgi:hypothetical protein